MYLTLNEEDILKLGKAYNYNILVNQLVNFYFYDYDLDRTILSRDDITSRMMKELEEMKEEMEEEIDLDDFINQTKILDIKELDLEQYKNDLYFKNIDFKSVKDKDYFLGHESYSPYQLFTFDELSYTNQYYQEKINLGYFKDKFTFISLKKNNLPWMQIVPHEINTMKKAIEELEGDILVFGLGLGYIIYHLSLKPSVKSINVIEKDKNIIKLFKENILPLFNDEQRKKITFEIKDAFSLKKEELKQYDSSFIDLYHTAFDGLYFFLKFIKEDSLNNPIFWIENEILLYIRRIIISLILDEHYGIDGRTKINKKELNSQLDSQKFNEIVSQDTYNSLKKTLKDKEIKSIKDINSLLTKESLIEIIKKSQFVTLEVL